MGITMSIQKPENIFFTKHFLSVIGIFYITTINPAIDNMIESNLSKKEIGKIVNALFVTIVGASLKAFDKDVYIPGPIGRDKKDAVNNILMQTIQNQIDKPIEEISKAIVNPIEQITKTITNPIESVINNPLDSINKTIKDFNNPISLLQNTHSLKTEPYITNTIIRAKQDTYFKDKPVDSTNLDGFEKLEVLKDTNTYIDSYQIDESNNHVKIELENTHNFLI